MIAASAVAAAQAKDSQSQPGNGTGEPTVTVVPVKTGLFVITGGGCNSVLRLSANGSILVDGKLPGNYEVLLKRANRIADMPVRALILTDNNDSHIGNNAKFVQAGTRIVAQENAKERLPAYTLSDGTTAPPIITYDREYDLRLGGIEAELRHFGNARTSGDTVVYFPNLKIVAVGDLLAAAPNPDFSAGGSMTGWGPVLAQILKLDFDVVVPSTGPVATRADLEAFKSKMDTLVSRATTLVGRGVAKKDLMAQLKTDDLGIRLSFSDDQIDHFYAELASAK
jgi:glyoxylase-like metal-dependent hydrolase (beta-lactamase superfamily II)